MINKLRQRKKKNFKSYGQRNIQLNALIENIHQKIVKNKKRRKTEKELQHFQDYQIFNDDDKKNNSGVVESVENRETLSSSSKQFFLLHFYQ